MWRRRRGNLNLFVSSCLGNQVNDHSGARIQVAKFLGKFIVSGWKLEDSCFLLASFAFSGRSCVAQRLETTVKVASLIPIDSESREVASLPERVGKRAAAVQELAFRLPCLDLNENQGHLLCCNRNYGFRRCTFRFQGHPSIPSHFCTLQARRFFLFIFFMLQHLKCKVNA